MNAYQMFGLRRLSQLLRELPPEKFDMTHWSKNRDGDPADLHACGTSGCIGGWSTLFFDGLRILRATNISSHTDLICNAGSGESGCGYGAVALAWGVHHTEAEVICSSTRVYESPSDAADAIDELIEKYFIGEGNNGYVYAN